MEKGSRNLVEPSPLGLMTDKYLNYFCHLEIFTESLLVSGNWSSKTVFKVKHSAAGK